MKYAYFRSGLAVVLALSVTASQGICYAKMLSTEATSCHVETTATDCCDASSQPAQAEIKCCPKHAAEAKTFIVQNPLIPYSLAPTILSATPSKSVLESLSQSVEPNSFFTTYVLKTTYSYHAPPLLG